MIHKRIGKEKHKLETENNNACVEQMVKRLGFQGMINSVWVNKLLLLVFYESVMFMVMMAACEQRGWKQMLLYGGDG
ncbi:hypothetical protein MtrunA17_Chr1g0199591 [Medicago truncatula]|uniref:Transmembrane protein, putative n=1 Tax=Medicago truncatula TaxID=3880 RepID=G7I518_MEDTR|nr:transmembrane protein, putative [Medicago truncatula]RHN81481.1 hypothetical protein MtrunA17_Chr1g0199591 [Medicago truncatula]